MQKVVFVLLFFILGLYLPAQSITTISGIAEFEEGKEIRVYAYEDFLSQVKTQIGSSKIAADSTFKISFFNHETRKLFIEVGNYHLSLYVQPQGDYKLYIEKGSPAYMNNPLGGPAEFFFLDLDSTDINYKIIIYDDYQLNFLERYYTNRAIKSSEFANRLDTFKYQIENRYKADTSRFFKTYIRYSIAALDDLSFVGQRDAYQKYDFYLKNEPFWYQNDRYMDYLIHYYDQYEIRLNEEIAKDFYKGVIKSSPSLIMNALGRDYVLENIRLREFVMVKLMGDIFYSKQYPQTNIVTILDSISNHALFEDNKKIAKNIKFRLLDLKAGTSMPEFNLMIKGERKFKNDFSGKHVYFQFIDRNSRTGIEDLSLLQPLFQKYSKHIDFVTILVADEDDKVWDDPSNFIQENRIAWDISVVERNNSILSTMGVTKYPYYILMDATGYVVQAPALSPRPNNEYETIERQFFLIKRYYENMEKE